MTRGIPATGVACMRRREKERDKMKGRREETVGGRREVEEREEGEEKRRMRIKRRKGKKICITLKIGGMEQMQGA